MTRQDEGKKKTVANWRRTTKNDHHSSATRNACESVVVLMVDDLRPSETKLLEAAFVDGCYTVQYYVLAH